LEKITKEIIEEIIRNNEMELKATQSKLCVPIINRIYKKMSAGIKFSGIKVDNNIICDGHHRYIASIIANYKLEYLPSIVTSATTIIPWKSILFEENDWDTLAKIEMLNEQDADFNKILIDKIIDILK
jgi:hypothetical protein